MLTIGILLVIIPSFLYSLYLTGANPERAFFVTTTRLWELGIGAFLAIGAGLWPKIPRAVAILLGWSGLIAIGLSGVVISSSTAWPGYAALLPTLGTAAVIVAGANSGPAGPTVLLSLKPMVWVGGLSYSLYLWHWPLLIAADAYWDGLTPVQGLAVALFSAIPAYLCYRYVENPIRFSESLSRSNPLTLSVGVNLTAVGAVAGLVLVLATPSGTSGSPGEDAAEGAEQVQVDPDNPDDPDAPDSPEGEGQADEPAPGTVESLEGIEWFTPSVTEAAEDLAQRPEDEGCQVDQVSSEPIRCEYGDADGDVTIVAVGDSKILQWQTVFEELGNEHGWHFISYTKSACAFSAGTQQAQGDIYTSCAEWNEAVMPLIIEAEPDLVISTNSVSRLLSDPTDPNSQSEDALVDALVGAWTELSEADIPMVALLDNPTPNISVYECVADNMDDLAACTFNKEEGIEDSSAPRYEEAAEQVPGTVTLDIRDYICPDTECVPVIGDVLVYRQTSHITETYAMTLKPQMEELLVPIVEDLTQ